MRAGLRAGIGGLLLCLLGGAGAAAATLAEGWGLIRPLGDGAMPAAVSRADEIDELLGAFLTRLEIDKRTETFLRALRKRSFDMDLGQLYDMFPGRIQPKSAALRRRERRTLRASGANLGPEGYRLTFFPKSSDLPGRPFGRARGRLTLQPMPLAKIRGQGYRAEGDGRISLSGLSWQQIAQLGEAWLQELQRSAAADAVPALVAQGRSAHPLLESSSAQALLAEARRAMPATVAFIEKLVELQKLGRLVTEGPGAPYLMLELRLRLRLEAFESPYPELHDYLEDIEDLFRFTLAATRGDRGVLARWEIDSASATVKARLAVRGGAILPLDPEGRPLPDEALRFTQVERERFGAFISGLVRYHGMVMTLEKTPLAVKVRTNERRARFETRIATPPTIKYGGNAFYVVPLWAVDAFIPKNIDQHTRDFLAALAHGPDGKGTRLRSDYHNSRDDKPSFLRGRIEAAVMDNALVNLALKIVGRRIQPDDDAIADLRRLWSDFYTALSQDYRAARPALLAMP